MRFLLLVLLLLPGLAFAARSNSFVSSRDAVSLISKTNHANQGDITLALEFRLAPGWHIYWSNPGDAGLAPQVALDAPAAAGAINFPPPEYLLQDGVAAYVLSGDVVLPFRATGVGGQVQAQARWLVCRDICVPEHAAFTLSSAGGVSAEAALFPPKLIAASPFAARMAPDGTLSLAGASRAQVATARFFPSQPGAIVNAAPQVPAFNAAGMTLRLTPGPAFNAAAPLAGVLELTDPSGAMQALNIMASPGSAAEGPPLALWLGFAFLGGLLLNLMPCVFPVLAMKAFGLIRLGDAARGQVRREALGYTAGVLVAMLALAVALLGLRAAGGAAGWGFQFQSPVFVALLAWLVFCAGLSLAGAFTLSARIGDLALPHGSFFNGLLAVAVATPCTAPFMAGAVAAALAAPPVAALGVFLCLGLGLAAPFVLLAAVPALARLLPRPGAWMLLLQRLLSLPMFATALWLAWVMAREAGMIGVLLLLLGALCLGTALCLRRLRPLAVLAVVPLLLLRPAPAGAALTLPGGLPYTPARLAALRAAGQPVLVDVTAAWCITCLVNERAALAAPEVRATFTRTGTKLLVADWTDRDPAITTYLAANGRVGVPLYVFYPAQGDAQRLPQLLTPGIVERAVR